VILLRAVIISGGDITDYSYIKNMLDKDDFIICADSGYRHASPLGVIPNILVGDFDSIEKIPESVECLRYPTDKDFTDTEIAVDYGRKKDFKEFLLLGTIGTRLDHTLSNILMLRTFLDNNEKAVIINEHNKIQLINKDILLQENKGSIVSLLPLTTCVGVTTTNLKYPLNNATLSVGYGLGVSNIMLQNNAKITLESGEMLIIIAKD